MFYDLSLPFRVLTKPTYSTKLQVSMRYEVAQIIGITFYYVNTICNPVIYFFSHPYTKKDLLSTDI